MRWRSGFSRSLSIATRSLWPNYTPGGLGTLAFSFYAYLLLLLRSHRNAVLVGTFKICRFFSVLQFLDVAFCLVDFFYDQLFFANPYFFVNKTWVAFRGFTLFYSFRLQNQIFINFGEINLAFISLFQGAVSEVVSRFRGDVRKIGN